MKFQLGVDFSQWGGPLKPETVDCWKQQGVEFAILQYSELTRQHLSVIENKGIDLSIYTYLYWGQSPWGQTPAQRVQNTIGVIRGSSIRHICLDAEDSTHPYREDQLEECEHLVRNQGYIPVIYTGGWWWRPNTNNSTKFSHLDLWDAYYTSESPNADLSRQPKDYTLWRPYGGWTKPTIWQWHNTTLLCDHSVDLNVREGASEDVRIEHQKYAAFISNNAFAGGQDWNGEQDINARVDFELPPEAKYVEIEFLVRNGYAVIVSGSGIESGQVGWGANKQPAREVCTVGLRDGWFKIKAPDPNNPVYFFTARSIAYYT